MWFDNRPFLVWYLSSNICDDYCCIQSSGDVEPPVSGRLTIFGMVARLVGVSEGGMANGKMGGSDKKET